MTSDVVIYSHASLTGNGQTFRATLGRHIRTDPQPIARHCLKILTAISEDIATIVESMALADRIQTRQRSRAWTRRLDLEIPVYEFETLSKPSVHSSLIDAAKFLTGDDWRISFSRRSSALPNEPFLPLIAETPDFVVPFSDGLDSFAQSKLLRAEHGDAAIWDVRVGNLQKTGSRSARVLFEVPRGFRVGHPRERTYRTRPFVYFSFAAIAAATAGAKAVIIGENGEGSLGPSFARFGNEWPFRSAHPGFVARLADFLSNAMNRCIEFRQPQLWRTKGEVMSELKDRDLLDGWTFTRSCSLRPLQRKGQPACGFCGGCILRQTALNAAGIVRECNLTFNLNSPDLLVINRDGSIVQMGQNEREIFVRAVLSMAHFAEVPLKANSSRIIAREARDIPNLSTEVASMRLSSLIHRHATDWKNLLEGLPRDAWLSRQFVPR